MIKRFLSNHVLANLTFVLVLALGMITFLEMPRARDPEINFNWINIITILPGASAQDVERRVTDPIEDALSRSVQDIRFVSSTSREAISNILVRFNQLDERTFDKRVIDLRREVQNTYNDELPEEADDPVIYEITSSSSLPVGTIVVSGLGNDENFRRQTRNIKKDLERIKGVDKVNAVGLSDPELHVAFLPDRLEGLGITPADLSDTVMAYFRDTSAGDFSTQDGQWVVRMAGTDSDPEAMVNYPIVTAQGVVPLGSIAKLVRSTEEPNDLVRFDGEPAAMLAVTKQANVNVLDLIQSLETYIEERNALNAATGVTLHLVDDQTVSTRQALSLMQNNAIIGLVLVLLVTWAFLGSRIAILTSIGIPFTLGGTFFILNAMGMSLNNTVLLGVVISLGMLVDDAVVVVEAIYHRLRTGMDGLTAAVEALREVFAPVTTSVMTTMAAFLPLMLLPGILGEFMKVIPMVVTLALAVSLIEAYWMLPAHIHFVKINFKKPRRSQQVRDAVTHTLRIGYVRWLLITLRHPIISVAGAFLLFVMAMTLVSTGQIRFNFFEADALRLFYVNVEMPRGTTLEKTTESVTVIQKRLLKVVQPGELRGSVAYAGQMFTETEPLFGDNVGQIQFSFNPQAKDGRHVDEIGDEVEEIIQQGLAGASNITLFRVKDGPPTSRAISVKVRGDSFAEIKEAADYLKSVLDSRPEFNNTSLDFREGNPELVLKHDGEAVQKSGLNPLTVSRSLSAYVDGEIVTTFQDQGEEIQVRVLSAEREWSDIDALLRQTLPLPGGQSIALGELVTTEYGYGQQNIRHYNFRRAITLESDIEKTLIDTVAANQLLLEEWDKVKSRFPNIDLEFAGELDDIEESLQAMPVLFTLGIGLMYIILGTQFKSYWQPFMVLLSVPLAFTGVVFGLFITGNPISLYTLYGMVALAGISVNASIVLISAANERISQGMSVLHATVYAARRRVVPILITSLTTIAGLFSLAAGLAGDSLIWGPVATAIVSGLAVSTVLTLFVVPLVFRSAMTPRKKSRLSFLAKLRS